MIKNILCSDLDGPIINCEERYYSVYRDNILELGGHPLSKEEYWQKKCERVSESDILGISSVDREHFDAYMEMKISNIEKREYLELDTLQPETHEILSSLKPFFDKLLLITLRRNYENLMDQIKALSLDKHFDHILSGYDENVPSWKTKSDLFFKNIDSCKNDGFNGYFVGDTEVDILAGKDIGLKTVAVLSGIRTEDLLVQYKPDYLVKDMKAFSLMLR